MLKTWIEQERVGERIIKIVPIPDVPDDNEWIEMAMQATGMVDVVLGNNNWVNDLYRVKRVPVIETDMYKRHLYEGKKIRAKMRKNGELT